MFSPGPNIPAYENVYPSIVRWDLPITYFYHIEYPILKISGIKDLTHKTKMLDQIRNEHDYNFMMEEQMFRSFMATLQTDVELQESMLEKWLYALQNKMRTKQQLAIYLEPVAKDGGAADAGAETGEATDAVRSGIELAGEYRDTVGVKLELGEKYLGHRFHVDSDVYLRKGNDLFFGVGEKVKLYLDPKEDAPHLARANGPVEVRVVSEGAGGSAGGSADPAGAHVSVNVEVKGLQQLKFYAPRGMDVLTDGWKVERDGDYYVLTRYGDATVLEIQYR